jgi:hypothetical protein
MKQKHRQIFRANYSPIFFVAKIKISHDTAYQLFTKPNQRLSGIISQREARPTFGRAMLNF